MTALLLGVVLGPSPVATPQQLVRGGADPGTVIAPQGLSPVEAGALQRISYPWASRLPGWSVAFLPARPGLLGATYRVERRIEIYVRADQTVDEVAFTLGHELGHAVDLSLGDDGQRAAWLRARGVPDAPWWVADGAADFASGAGDFAEAFAVWQTGGTGESRLAPHPTADQLALVAAWAAG